jgi:hypothetical protein
LSCLSFEFSLSFVLEIALPLHLFSTDKVSGYPHIFLEAVQALGGSSDYADIICKLQKHLHLHQIRKSKL